jgi:hypothetical protein
MNSGEGRIVLCSNGSSIAFSELSATYPLKLLSPRITQAGVAIVYVLSYGGGLVGGDQLKLAVEVGPGCILVLLSQVLTEHASVLFLDNLCSYCLRAPPKSSRLGRGVEPQTSAYLLTKRQIE